MPARVPDLRRFARTHPVVRYDASLMIAVVWQFDVKAGREKEFEALYGADGDWTALNRQTRSYLGSSFLRDQNRASRYLLIEYWSEMVVYEQHRASRPAMMETIEARRAELVDASEPLGIYTALDVPERWGPTWSVRS
jgi:quinol monooxygenase YgiN